MENNPASLLAVCWARHITVCLHLYVADRWRGLAFYPSWWLSLTEDSKTKHELLRSVFTSDLLQKDPAKKTPPPPLKIKRSGSNLVGLGLVR